jgi:hypothetical protein
MLERSCYTHDMAKEKTHTSINPILVVDQTTKETTTEPNSTDQLIKATKEKNAAAVALGRLGGLKGGKARAERLDPEYRKQIAKKAAMTRWTKVK